MPSWSVKARLWAGALPGLDSRLVLSCLSVFFVFSKFSLVDKPTKPNFIRSRTPIIVVVVVVIVVAAKFLDYLSRRGEMKVTVDLTVSVRVACAWMDGRFAISKF